MEYFGDFWNRTHEGLTRVLQSLHPDRSYRSEPRNPDGYLRYSASQSSPPFCVKVPNLSSNKANPGSRKPTENRYGWNDRSYLFYLRGSRFSWNLNIWMSFLRSVRAQTIARFIIIKNLQNQDLIWRIYSECVFLTFKIYFRILSKETQNPFLFKIQECVWIFQTRRTPRNSWPLCLAGALKHLSSHKEKGEINLQALHTINIFRDYSLVKVNLSGHKLILSNYQVIYFMIALNAYRSSAWRRDSNSRRLIWTWKIGTW